MLLTEEGTRELDEFDEVLEDKDETEELFPEDVLLDGGASEDELEEDEPPQARAPQVICVDINVQALFTQSTASHMRTH